MPGFSARAPGATVQACPRAEPAQPQYWIEIALVGEDGAPIPWEAYEVRLPDGRRVPGYLDADGLARLEQLPGEAPCEVRFPGLDKFAWEPLEPCAAGSADDIGDTD